MSGNQDISDNPLTAGPKLVAPKPKYIFDPTELPEQDDSSSAVAAPVPNSSSSPPPPPTSTSSPFFSPLYSIPQREPSPSVPSSPQIVNPPSRASLRSPKPEPSKTPTPKELLLFESHCKSFFGLITTINQDGIEVLNLISDLDINEQEKLELESRQKLSQSFIDRVLSNCPASHRATYNRIQSKARQLYHSQVEVSRQKSLNLLIKSIEPNSKLAGFSQNHLHSLPSRIERFNLLKDFISKHCSKNKVGIHPFLASLKSIFNLQRISSASGGGGPISLVWKLDDAVLMETGGEVFMKDAIELLKGGLGFTEHPVNASSSGSTLDEEDPFKDHQNISQYSTNLGSINKRSSLMGGPGTSVPGFSSSPPTYLRFWYLGKHLSNTELYYLSREIPKYVLSGKAPPKLRSISEKELSSLRSPSRLEQAASNSNGIYALNSNDREDMVSNSTTASSLNSASGRTSKDPVSGGVAPLATGVVLRGDPQRNRREKGWRGTLLQRFLIWLRSLLTG